MSSMLECLKGLIGLSAQVATCDSGLYVVDLPGISLSNIEKIADRKSGEDVDPSVVFEQCERRALLSFRNAFIASMCDCWSIDLDIAECLLCEYKSRLATALWWFVGYEILVERVSSDRLNRYTTMDRKKASELSAVFLERAETELKNLVRGLDPNKSSCVEEHMHCAEFITKVTPII